MDREFSLIRIGSSFLLFRLFFLLILISCIVCWLARLSKFLSRFDHVPEFLRFLYSSGCTTFAFSFLGFFDGFPWIIFLFLLQKLLFRSFFLWLLLPFRRLFTFRNFICIRSSKGSFIFFFEIVEPLSACTTYRSILSSFVGVHSSWVFVKLVSHVIFILVSIARGSSGSNNSVFFGFKGVILFFFIGWTASASWRIMWSILVIIAFASFFIIALYIHVIGIA